MITEEMLPPHKCSLTIEHNGCRDCYETVDEWLKEYPDMYDWLDAENRQRAIDTNEIWVMTVYPHTPIGSYALAAPTLDELMRFAQIRTNQGTD